jgi:hypothetical protein
MHFLTFTVLYNFTCYSIIGKCLYFECWGSLRAIKVCYGDGGVENTLTDGDVVCTGLRRSLNFGSYNDLLPYSITKYLRSLL